MKIALLQINPTVGDLSGNARLILEALEKVRLHSVNRYLISVQTATTPSRHVIFLPSS